MTQIPDITRGTHLVFVKCNYFCTYFKDGKKARHSLQTEDLKEAMQRRDEFYSLLRRNGATVKRKPQPVDKVRSRPNSYIYYRKPYVVRVPGHEAQFCESEEEAISVRDSLVGCQHKDIDDKGFIYPDYACKSCGKHFGEIYPENATSEGSPPSQPENKQERNGDSLH